ncbi:MAG: RDD family protein [Flavobacteriaceae bacterium]|nr:RDD family protein [Flavobacteriaceae bacterium]
MNSIAINTSQNVNLEFAVASLGDRMAAFLIDTVIKLSYIILLWVIFEYVIPIDSLLQSWDQWSLMAFIIIILLPVELYTLVCESLMEGQTPGKRMMKIKVVKIDAYQAKFSDYLIRWFFRIVDILLSTAIVGLISMIFSPYNQRLGGIASGTAVISLKRRVNINHTILQEISSEYQPHFPQVVALTDYDMRIIKDNFDKAIQLKEYSVIMHLAQKIRETTGISNQNPTITDQEFIRLVIQDFNFFTGKEI